MSRWMVLLLPLFYLCCSSGNGNSRSEISQVPQSRVDTPEIGALEMNLIAAGLVNVRDTLPGVLVDLKYSTTDNFLQADVYGDLAEAYLQPDVLQKLKNAYTYLIHTDSSLTFLIYDAARPLSVQQKMWDIVNVPGADKTEYVSNPLHGSIHNYGAAVDLTLCKRNGAALDMGTPFDYFGELAQPQIEGQFLSDGKLSKQQLDNRKLLRTVMQQAGFRQLPTEWWHYNACSRETAKIKYRIIE